MSTGLYTHRTRNAGEIVRDTLYNPAHKNHQINDVPNMAGALSDTLTDYREVQDPAPGGVPNLVLSVEEEFQQLRFAVADIKTALNNGTPLLYWYVPVDVSPFVVIGKGARVYRSTPQSISFKTPTPIVNDTVRYDTGATSSIIDPFFVIGQPTRLTATVAGLYQFNAFVLYASGGTGTGVVATYFRLNGGKLLAATEWPTDGSHAPQLAISAQYLCAANDYVELVLFQTEGNPTLSAITAEFGLELLNPATVIAPPAQFLLSIVGIGTGSGVVTSDVGGINCPGTCNALYAANTFVTLTATPTVGGFVEWSGDVPIGDEFNNPLVVTMDQARAINARFTAYTLNIVEAGTGAGIVVSDIGGINCPGTCSAQYAPGDIVQLTATSTIGTFQGWTGDLTSSTNPDSITMDADKTVTATFDVTGVIMSLAVSALITTGTKYLGPTVITRISTTIGDVQFKLPNNVTFDSISVTMAAALAGGHTTSFQFNIGGVDDGSIVLNLVATDIEGQANGALFVPADTLICIKVVQAGGNDSLQSLTLVYRPA